MLILDKSPKICAKHTPKSLVKETLHHVLVGYNYACSKPFDYEYEVYPTYRLVEMDLRRGYSTIQWYQSYVEQLLEMDKIISTNDGVEPFKDFVMFEKEVILNNFITADCSPHIHNPAYDSAYIKFIGDKFDNDNVITSRAILTKMEPTNDEFLYGVPVWLRSISKIVYSGYDVINHRHIKIENTHEGYKYYTSFISDNWEEIKNVPKEMEIIINQILSD